MSAIPLLVCAAAVLALLRPEVEACFAAGVGCCGPPPPAPVCAGGCGPGYGCGQYGCARLRARVASSKTLKLEDIEGEDTEVTPEPVTPDEKFMACCIDRRLPDSCLNKCSFATYNRDALQNMYFRVDACPMQAAADLQFCAAQGRDHRECCARNGVTMTLSGPKCLLFCDQRPGNQTQLDLSYMSCFDRFENMKGCFWNDIVQRQATSSWCDHWPEVIALLPFSLFNCQSFPLSRPKTA
ncbi:DB domain-containing protein [Aphelenchoides fujianensis]|nr:DB domain-containing protein [Aphelenchoides fujianensis]